MPVCELRHATTEDTDSVYALICELLKNELDYQAFRDGFAANLLVQRSLSFSAAQRRGGRHDQPAYAVSSPSCQLDWRNSGAGGITADAGTKIGSQLLAWAEEEARQAGAELTELSTNIKRRDAHRFYLREGYKQSHFRFTKAL